MSKKRIVNSFMANKIYHANILADGTMGEREDVTEDAIYAVAHLMETNLRVKGKSRLILHGIGVMQFTPEDEVEGELREEIRRLRAKHDEKKEENQED